MAMATHNQVVVCERLVIPVEGVKPIVQLQPSHTHNYKEKLVIVQLIGIKVIKSKEIKVVTYTCSGYLIPKMTG